MAFDYDNDITVATTNETTIVAAPGASQYRDLLYISAYSLTTNQNTITVRDGTAGTVRAILAIRPTEGQGHAELRPVTPLRQVTANKTWSVQLGTAASTYIFAQARPRADV